MGNDSHPPQSVRTFRKQQRKTRRRMMLFAAVALAAGGYWIWVRYTDPSGIVPGAGSMPIDTDRFVKVTRGKFNITILVDGTLDAIKRHDLRVEARGHFPLIISRIVDDNSEVEADDVVMEFQQEKFIEKVEDLERNIEEISRDLSLNIDDMSMRKTNNLAKIKTSVDDVTKAEEELEKYKDFEAPKARRDHVDNINNAQTVVDTAKAELSDAQAALAKVRSEGGSTTSAEATVKTKTKALEDAEKKLATANQDQRVWRQYDYPQRLRALNATVERARLNLRSAQAESESSIFQLDRRISWLRTQRRNRETERRQYLEDIKNLVLVAPTSGIVSLGNINRPRWEPPKEWKVGLQVGSREICASIPDLSKYMVKCQIPEEQRSKARIGQRSTFKSAAIPGLLMTGGISEISPVSTSIDPRDQASPKVYETTIVADTVDERLKPGMTVKVEIVVETVENAIYVPVEAVYGRDNQRYVQVRTRSGPGGQTEERVVKTGRSSFSFVEIVEGLSEGDEVAVVPATPQLKK